MSSSEDVGGTGGAATMCKLMRKNLLHHRLQQEPKENAWTFLVNELPLSLGTGMCPHIRRAVIDDLFERHCRTIFAVLRLCGARATCLLPLYCNPCRFAFVDSWSRITDTQSCKSREWR
jgi:hypothetical protein